MTTLRDVAEHAKVSPGTVSLMMNGRIGGKPQTRRRIERAVEELGYKPRAAGRPTEYAKANPVLRIALVIAEYAPEQAMRHPLERPRITCLRKAIAESGNQMSMFAGTGHIDDNWVLRDAVDSGDFDGIILVSPRPDDGYTEWLVDRGIPLVMIERRPDYFEYSHLNVDNYAGGRQAAEHLIGLGHRRLGFLQANGTFHWMHLRERGFRDAAKRAGAQVVDSQLLVPEQAITDHIPACRRLLDQAVTGIFAANDGIAWRGIEALAEMQVAVPGEVSVIGFDDLGHHDRHGQRLSSIRYDMQAMADNAVGMMQRLLDPDNHCAQLATCIQTELKPYQTTGPAAQPTTSREQAD